MDYMECLLFSGSYKMKNGRNPVIRICRMVNTKRGPVFKNKQCLSAGGRKKFISACKLFVTDQKRNELPLISMCQQQVFVVDSFLVVEKTALLLTSLMSFVQKNKMITLVKNKNFFSYFKICAWIIYFIDARVVNDFYILRLKSL
jgi:hypothetical protein